MIRLLDQRIHYLPLKTRMPFRYGIATMTDLPMAFVFLKFQFGKYPSESCWGVASDLLPPRWFRKNPEQSPAEEIEEMKTVLNQALLLAGKQNASTPFDFWLTLARKQGDWAKQNSIPDLLANFGVTFVERALLDAFARFSNQPLAELLRDEKLGLNLGAIHPELSGLRAAEFLPDSPLAEIHVRHTVGFGDPLTENEISSEDRVSDQLPQSLEAAIETYGLSQFKIKIKAVLEEDLTRLEAIEALLKRLCGDNYALSLDGNEQFESWKQFTLFWEAAQSRPKLRSLLDHILFIEQPISRHSALAENSIGQLPNGQSTPPVIIDESDAGLESFRLALDCGYQGVSHKNCKGVFKGIANRCLIQKRNRDSDTKLFMSGEDLCNIGPVALLQDLAIQSILGNASVERNGHHYFYGLSQFPSTTQSLLVDKHPELYKRAADGTAILKIKNGMIKKSKLLNAPFAAAFTPEELYNSLVQDHEERI